MVQTEKIRLIRYLLCLSVQIKGEDSSSNKLFNWWSQENTGDRLRLVLVLHLICLEGGMTFLKWSQSKGKQLMTNLILNDMQHSLESCLHFLCMVTATWFDSKSAVIFLVHKNYLLPLYHPQILKSKGINSNPRQIATSIVANVPQNDLMQKVRSKMQGKTW